MFPPSEFAAEVVTELNWHLCDKVAGRDMGVLTKCYVSDL